MTILIDGRTGEVVDENYNPTPDPVQVMKMERNQLLAETDWWCCSDRTPTQAQLDYRQALRDLPENSTPAWDKDFILTGVEWPTKPE